MEKKAFRKKLPLLVILFLVGIIFLAIGEYHSIREEGEFPAFSQDSYTNDLENRLCEMLSTMEGVSDVKVMVTLEGTSHSSGDMQSAFSEEPVYWIDAPKIRGVSVVCRGANNAKTKEKILDLIAGTLNLNKNKIYVTQ